MVRGAPNQFLLRLRWSCWAWDWVSDIKNGTPPGETSNIVANGPTVTSPANPHWNWGKPFPFYVPIGVSYVAGFCIGWVFRKLIRLIVITVALVVALLALGRLVGCDTTHTQEQVKHTGERLQHEMTAEESYLKHLLPSVGAGGVGTLLGFRRRGRAVTPGSGTKTIPPPQ
jgi:uncharacterized membrane protein (Fun14 family)